MVYVFFVQPGDMMTFDNEISIMQSVGDLKEKIKEICNIPVEQQVLLISGGEPLDTQKNLCSYMAGTDTNPIYLFSTNFDLSKLDILKNLNYDDADLIQRLLDSLTLPVSLTTVKTRTLIAQDFYNTAKLQLEFCENMVHEQHLQQQGWSAVIANLEDIVSEFRKRWDLFQKMYNEFIADKDTYDVFLQSFEEDKQILRRIPVIDTLLNPQKEPMDGSKLSETATSTSEIEPTKEISLFDWISSSDTKNSLDDIYELCKSNLKKFEKEIMPSLEKQINDTLQYAEVPERKEIEGLGKRLFDLEELLRKIKKNVEHQSDMFQSFQQNQNRAAHIKDLSILPDLCATHLQQLEYIKQCHEKLMGDRNRIVRAKNELSKSLCARIGWVQNVENKLWELDSLLVYFHEHLQRLRKHLEVFQQLHLTPVTYMNAVVEVVRRRAFSQLFLMWASDLACQQLTIHNEELTRRKEFSSQFEGHILKSLFPGMGDVPPPFATEAPAMFDAKLPQVTEEDIEKLKREVPDFSEYLTLPDMQHIVNFFLGKASEAKESEKDDKVDDAKAVEERLIQAVSDVGLASNLDKNLLKATGSEPCLVTVPGLPNLKDDKGCESETDTEEFEKVGQSPLELNFPQGTVPKPAEKQDASTSTEDNLQISRSEHEKVKSIVIDLGTIAREATTNLRTELNNLKSQYLTEAQVLSRQYEDLGSSWENLVLEFDRNEKEVVESMKRHQETEREQYRYNLLEKDHVVARLEQDKRVMEDRIQETCKKLAQLEEDLAILNRDSTNRIEELLKEIREKDLDKERSLKELTETLKSEHKAEIENIKARFKLMTMEKSPSLSSLEKEKTGDFSSLPGHATLFAQMTENFEMDKENAVLEERQRCEKEFEEKLKEMKERFEEEKNFLTQDVAKRISDDKDKQIDVLREREKNLNLEIIKYKTTIQQLAECEAERKDSDMMEQVEVLKKEREVLKEELEKVLEEKETLMTTSVAVCEGKIDATTSPLPSSPPSNFDLSRSEIAVSNRPHRLNIDTCKPGDVVLVLWDGAHENFKILQESKHTFFLHSDCLEKLGLSISEKTPNKIHCTGEVVDKEYCIARKGENRYKVPKGTKFFRVKVKPTGSQSKDSKDLSQSLYSTRHTPIMSTSQSVIATFDPLMEESQSPTVITTTTERLEEVSEQPAEEQSEACGSSEGRDMQERGRGRLESGRSDSETTRTDSESGRIDVIEQPEELRPKSVEKNFAEDSGIVENVEQAIAAIEDFDRFESCREVQQSTYISTNWFEAMFRSMFSKTSQ